jgi:hypothetical protein
MSARYGTIDDLAAAIATTAGPLLSTGLAPDERGLYLATYDAGIDVAVTFWADALESSPRFANPAEFPWTLANAPAGLISRTLDIRGPSYTLVGGAEAMSAALAHADHDLTRGRIREAVVVGCDLASEVQAAVLALTGRRPALQVPPTATTATEMLMRHGGRVVGKMAGTA